MKLENSFEVPVPIDEAWAVLLDVERIAPCMPGATLDSADGTTYEGRVKIKAGPVTVSYAGVLRMESADEATHTVVLDAQGKEQRGSGTVKAMVTARVHPGDGTSRVDVTTDLAITGKPAQLGRGLIADVGGKIIDQFARNLAAEISAPESGNEEAVSAGHSDRAAASGQAPSTPYAAREVSDSLDMLAILKPHLIRAATVLGLSVVLGVVLKRLCSRN